MRFTQVDSYGYLSQLVPSMLHTQFSLAVESQCLLAIIQCVMGDLTHDSMHLPSVPEELED